MTATVEAIKEKSKGDILVVDDRPENLRLLSQILSEHHYKVRKVTSGKQAINAIKINPPELVLLDILMPDMNGYEVCQQIKADPNIAATPIIFLSALDNTIDKVKAFEVGGVDYITKPFQIEEIIARVNNQITILHQRKSLQEQQNLLNQQNQQLKEEIAERKKTELALAKAKEEAEAASKSKSDFLSNMTHEIRTPMNGIIGVAQLLRLTTQTPEQQSYTQLLQESADILLNLLNDILDFSKIESKKLQLENRMFNLMDSLKFVYELLKQSAINKDIQLEYKMQSHVPEAIIGDEYRLRQILLNLIINAIKFTDSGKVTIEASYEDIIPRHLHLAIADTGIGIQGDRLATLFNPFTQVDTSISRKYGGTGLGLAICKNLVELMEGHIWVESLGNIGGNPPQNWLPSKTSEDLGAIFHFTIALPSSLPSSSKPKDDAINIDSEMAKKFPLRILLAEDNPMNQRLISIILQKFGYQITIANNGLQALEAVRSQMYDVVLMDVQMPEMDGISATRWIRQNLAYQPYIVAITANSSILDRQSCLESGMNNFISKPVKIQELARIISNASKSKTEQI